MSLAVTSSMTWCCLRPLIAANMPRIMSGGAPGSWAAGSGDFGDRGRVDAGETADGDGGDAVLGGGDLLDLAAVQLVVGVEVGDIAADQADRGRGVQRRGDLRVGARHVRDLLDHGERRHLLHRVV